MAAEGSTRARLEIKVLGYATYSALHLWAVTGAGGGTRRKRLYTVRVPLPLRESDLPAILRAAAVQVETPFLDRWCPPEAVPGPPWGGYRGD